MSTKMEKYIALAVTCMLALPACRQEEPLSTPESRSQSPIELTVGITGANSAATKTVITSEDNPYGHEATTFGANTTLYMVMKSDNATESESKYTRTMGTVAASASSVAFATGYVRFWEDSYSRDSKLSVYSACVPGKASALNIGGGSDYSSNTWIPSIATTIAWPMFSGSVASQTADFIANQDLCFSNNVSKHSSDDRMIFYAGRFTTGNMIFYHALTRITFRIKKGNGWGTDPFSFTNANENIVLKGFNATGTFTISSGEFTSSSTADITQLVLTDHRNEVNPTCQYELDGILLPGSLLEGTATDQVYFTIDENRYHLTKNQLRAALDGKKLSNNTTTALEVVGAVEKKMRPGVHYIFDLTLGKKEVDKITASVVPWEVVEATTTPTNARIEVSLLDNGNKVTADPADFDLYRTAHTEANITDTAADYTEWTTNYTISGNKAILKPGAIEDGHMVYTALLTNDPEEVPWYWPDNKTFYHFRTVKPINHTVHNDSTYGDYIDLTTAAPGYTDVCWGAPFYGIDVAGGARLTYDISTHGFDGTTPHQISKAIGPTNGTINLEMFHMMSDVSIKLTTTTGADAVNLDGATISLSNIYPTGIVRMGTGLVEPTGSVGDVATSLTYTDLSKDSKVDNYGFVPQDLTMVVLTITTADHNQYIVPMKDVVSSNYTNYLIANPYTETGGKINRWYPNFKYNYTFNLTKTGITQITATLANWETVNAGDDNVQIR